MPTREPTPGNRRLIVNADDLGYTAGINAGIFEAHHNGLVTSTTLMVGFPAAEAAARNLPQYPDLGVGLHVALTGGRPVLAPEKVPSLVDASGRLPHRPDGLDEADPNEIIAEVRAQLRSFQDLTGRRPTHLDSHHHSHRRPAVLEALMTVARETQLPIRNTEPEVGRRLRRAGLTTTDRFDETFFGSGATAQSLLDILDRLPTGVTELMCHPAQIDGALRETSSYVDERAGELVALTAAEARKKIEHLNIELIHFGSLA